MATFQTASLLNIIEQGQKMESVFVDILLETAMKLSSITDANVLVVVDTARGRKWAGRRSLKDEFVEELNEWVALLECSLLLILVIPWSSVQIRLTRF